MKRPPGKLHSQDTHNRGNIEGGGIIPATRDARARGLLLALITQHYRVQEEKL